MFREAALAEIRAGGGVEEGGRGTGERWESSEGERGGGVREREEASERGELGCEEEW